MCYSKKCGIVEYAFGFEFEYPQTQIALLPSKLDQNVNKSEMFLSSLFYSFDAFGDSLEISGWVEMTELFRVNGNI